MGKKLTESQKKLRRDFPRGKRVILLGSSSAVVRGHKGDYVRVLCEGPAIFGMVLALGKEMTV